MVVGFWLNIQNVLILCTAQIQTASDPKESVIFALALRRKPRASRSRLFVKI